jgi:hypothetical protein
MMKHAKWMVTAALALSTAAAAQTPPPAATLERALVEQQAQAAQQAPTIGWAQATQTGGELKVPVRTKTTRGAPYSADTITESVQAIADGNRIVRRTTTRMWRDSEGRTRTEVTNAQGVQSVMIADPMSGETWVLNPEARTAFRAGVFVYDAKGEGNKVTVTTMPRDWTQSPPPPPPPPPPPASAGAVGVTGGLYRLEGGMKAEGKITREDLGQQTIEGLTATGTRTTTVIPAGAIGNELPIRIVSEQWYSPDLQLLVMTKFSDPRSGETTFRVTNVSRSEPDRSLFTVPPDYTIKESKIQRQAR